MKAIPVGVLAALFVQAPLPAPASRNTPYSDIVPILTTLRPDLLPLELRGKTPVERESAWPGWVTRRDREIRIRLVHGEEDSIVNLLLFGVTFTGQPRLTEHDMFGGLVARSDIARLRIEDLARGAGSPGSNERLRLVAESLAQAGIDPATSEGQARARVFLAGLLERTLADVQRYIRENAAGDRLNTLYRDRGLSSDTSILPGFAVDEALTSVARVFAGGAIHRVAIVGPGLDFDDKREGYDFYPQQTIQPFAVIESLIRLGLARVGDLRVTTFDVNQRVNRHLNSAKTRAHAGDWYTLELPRSLDVRWRPELMSYWQRFGELIGRPVTPITPPSSAGNVQTRAVSVRPEIVLSITPQDLNIVLERVEPSGAADAFDLIIATNVLIYYDEFEQSLAVANIAHMLRSGGWFLTNDAVLKLPTVPMIAIAQTDLVYSDQLNSRERLVLYEAR